MTLSFGEYSGSTVWGEDAALGIVAEAQDAGVGKNCETKNAESTDSKPDPRSLVDERARLLELVETTGQTDRQSQLEYTAAKHLHVRLAGSRGPAAQVTEKWQQETTDRC